MSARTALATQQGYRLLAVRERIEHGDEALKADTVTWLPVPEVLVGLRYQPGDMPLPLRRPLIASQQEEALSGEVLAPSPQWISVHDKLPMLGARVLCFDGEDIAFCQCGQFWGKAHPYLWAAENYGYDGESGAFNCTYWMPLPAVPAK